MNAILELTAKLRDTSQAIAHHERALAANPSPSLTASLRSLQKRLSRLEADLAAVTAGQGIDVCRYRFFADFSTPAITPVCGALLHFQSMYALAFNAVKNGAKQIARLTGDVVEQTTFGFGYSFSGSLGIVMTFDNKQINLFETYMDDAMNALFSLAQSHSSEAIAKSGRILGAPTLKAAQQWANSHVQHGLGVDIQWVRGETVKNALHLDARQLGEFVDVLNSTSDRQIEAVTYDGIVLGGGQVKHVLQFLTDEGQEIKANYTDAISEQSPASWPKRYRAYLEKTTKVFYTSDRPDSVTYFLTKLEPVT